MKADDRIGAEFLVVMGITGAGKTEIASRLAAALGCSWIEADSFHSPENVERMRQGVGLTDELRWPWLAAVCRAARAEPGRPVVIACSALRRSYRDSIRDQLGSVRFLFLDGSPELIRKRLMARKRHFATASLLASQLATLDPPRADEAPICLDIARTPDEIVADAIARLPKASAGA